MGAKLFVTNLKPEQIVRKTVQIAPVLLREQRKRLPRIFFVGKVWSQGQGQSQRHPPDSPLHKGGLRPTPLF